MPYKRGAPTGNTNRLKHGRYRTTALAQRKLVRETIRSARFALLQATAALQFDRREAFRDNPLQESP
ncbi:MAG TPA: hypothetical protein VHW69_09805 [Rhizomicrobium sp.]|jgi:hypothetical protein|nr:hypothetical protein [Rhizomicrobium sp.]